MYQIDWYLCKIYLDGATRLERRGMHRDIEKMKGDDKGEVNDHEYSDVRLALDMVMLAHKSHLRDGEDFEGLL